MKTGGDNSIGEVPQKKDPYWWMHPAYRGEQALDMETLDSMPEGGYRWTQYSTAPAPDVDGAILRDTGHFTDFAQLLYKINRFQSGPVRNWYVVVCVAPARRWAVGQLCADSETPVQVFDDLIFDSEEAARACAEELRTE